MFTVSLKRSDPLFCLLIDPRDSPSRRLLRRSHPWSSFRWRPLREGRLTCNQFLPFSNVMSDIHGGWPEAYVLDQLSSLRSVKTDPLDGSADKLEMLYQNLTGWTSESSLVGDCISYIDLFMWIWKISTFSPDLAVTWGFLSKWLFSLSIRVHAFMNVLQWTVFVNLLGKTKTAQGHQNPSKGLVQLN